LLEISSGAIPRRKYNELYFNVAANNMSAGASQRRVKRSFSSTCLAKINAAKIRDAGNKSADNRIEYGSRSGLRITNEAHKIKGAERVCERRNPNHPREMISNSPAMFGIRELANSGSPGTNLIAMLARSDVPSGLACFAKYSASGALPSPAIRD
jgi:hypothetical protein